MRMRRSLRRVGGGGRRVRIRGCWFGLREGESERAEILMR